MALPGTAPPSWDAWIVDVPDWYEDLEYGFVVVHVDDDRLYWTGWGGDETWTRNPRRALVDTLAPWDMHGLRPLGGLGRSVRVLIEDEVTMLPIYKWPHEPGQIS